MKLKCFTNGSYSYAVNVDKIAFICMGTDGKVRVFFSGDEDDCIEVDEKFAPIYDQLTQQL